ncbi:hypothetical protein Tco_0246717 [Tanacetum coccineum]
MSDNTTKAQCKLCFHFLSVSSNSTLKAHINNKYCDALMTVPEAGLWDIYFAKYGNPTPSTSSASSKVAYRESDACLATTDHLDATERIQHTSNLENTLDFEEGIYDEEAQAGEAILLSDEEIAQDEAASKARSNGSEDEINFD